MKSSLINRVYIKLAFREGGKSKKFRTHEALDAPRMEGDNGREGEVRDWRRGEPNPCPPLINVTLLI